MITCLLVEQNESLIYLIQRYGQEVGMKIITASGAEAVERVGEIQPAVILLGADLPGKRGWETLRALKADRYLRHIPVIMYAGMDQRVQMLEEGADGCLQMPLVREDLWAELVAMGLLTSVEPELPPYPKEQHHDA
jgi:two-component system, cell cycle response regulator DivK